MPTRLKYAICNEVAHFSYQIVWCPNDLPTTYKSFKRKIFTNCIKKMFSMRCGKFKNSILENFSGNRADRI
jgi:hypothetical protein